MKFHLNDISLRNMTNNTSIQNQNCSILCLFLAEISMKSHSKDSSLRNKTHYTSFPNKNFSILCLFLAEISMKFHSENTSLRNMTHNTSIPNQIFSILCFFWLRFVWNFIEKIPPGTIWHITLLLQIKFSQFCASFGWN